MFSAPALIVFTCHSLYLDIKGLESLHHLLLSVSLSPPSLAPMAQFGEETTHDLDPIGHVDVVNRPHFSCYSLGLYGSAGLCQLN
jgi:hypothetical protein